MSAFMNGPTKEFAIGIYDGPHATPPEAANGPVFLGIKNVTEDGRLDFSTIKHVSEQDFPKWTKRVVPQENDIVFSYEATLHRYAMIPEGFRGCLGRRMALIRPDQTKVYPRFLHYYFLTPSWRAKVNAIVINGATVDRVPLTKFPDIEVTLPPLPQQKQIARVLAAYDDLIENNRRRIQLLEQAARLLYKEWFVHLRFPGHEHVKIKDGVPEGWEIKQVKDVLGKVKRPRKIKKADFLENGPIPCIDQSRDFIGGYTDDPDAVVDVDKPVIVFGDHTRILKFVNFPFACGADGTQLIVSNDKLMPQEYLYFALDAIDLSNYFYARHFKFLKDQSIIRPPSLMMSQFAKNVRPMMKQIFILREQNYHLAKARELLLPRLMNGEIPM
ncbi:MAG: restriction endonuclease subunit S [Deltaproteobacteria bacterium]|nr:restriction endonuclease subunit S [Deltaproteobacteria bacterium]